MAEYILRKRYANHYGLDLKSNDLVKDERFASDIENAQYRKNGTIEKRKGYHAHLDDVGGYGLFTYNKIDPDTGDPIVEELTIDENLYKSAQTTVSIEYHGTFVGTFFSNRYDADNDEFRANLQEDTNEVLDFSLGTGIDEATPVTIQDMIDEINGAQSRVDSDLAEAGSTSTVINATGHSVQVNDTIIFKTGDLTNESSVVLSTNANDFTVTTAFSAAPADGDKFDYLRDQNHFSAVPAVFSNSDDVEAASTDTVINATSHGAEAGDWIVMTSGNTLGENKEILSVTANSITLVSALSAAPATNDTFNIYNTEDNSDTSIPATFLTATNNGSIYQDRQTPYAKKWVQVYSPVSNPFSSYYAQIAKDDFINASFVQTSNNAYIGTGFDNVMKYDGNMVYRAGLPSVDSLAATLVGGGITGNNYVHRARYIQYDDSGNIIEGNILDTDAQTAAAQDFSIEVANIQAGTGFNTNCAIVAGAQVTVNEITVDDGSGGSHTMRAGDTAYFFDNVTGGYITREVTATSATTITVAGAAVTVDDNIVISNNLRIGIYRNKSSGTSSPSIFYGLIEIPNDSFSATTTVIDDITDTDIDNNPDLYTFLIEPLTDRSPPPKGKYLSAWNANMVIAGNLENPNFLYYSDIASPEYFPEDFNIINCDNVTGDIINGIVQNSNGFYIMKETSVGWLSGDINSDAFRLEWRSLDTGCESHHTITEVEGKIFWWSSDGPYWSAGGSPPLPVGRNPDGAGRIEPVMDQFGLTSDVILKPKQAVAINDRREQKWIVFLPATSSFSDVEYANANSRIFVYDYTRDAWLEWSNYNMMGGATTSGEEFYTMERRFSSDSGGIKHYTYRRLNLNDSIDYQDHSDPISFKYASQWEALGDPSVLKRFLEFRAFLVEDFFNNDLNLVVTQEINYVQDDPRIRFTINAVSGGYGQNEYGNNSYGDYSDTTVRHSLNRDRVRSTRLIFQNEEDQTNVFLTGWEIEAAMPNRKAFKR